MKTKKIDALKTIKKIETKDVKSIKGGFDLEDYAGSYVSDNGDN